MQLWTQFHAPTFKAPKSSQVASSDTHLNLVKKYFSYRLHYWNWLWIGHTLSLRTSQFNTENLPMRSHFPWPCTVIPFECSQTHVPTSQQISISSVNPAENALQEKQCLQNISCSFFRIQNEVTNPWYTIKMIKCKHYWASVIFYILIHFQKSYFIFTAFWYGIFLF